jgi:hypothetical protein
MHGVNTSMIQLNENTDIFEVIKDLTDIEQVKVMTFVLRSRNELTDRVINDDRFVPFVRRHERFILEKGGGFSKLSAEVDDDIRRIRETPDENIG